MQVHKCDKCETETGQPHILAEKQYYGSEIDGTRWELCDACYKKFKIFIRPKKKE